MVREPPPGPITRSGHVANVIPCRSLVTPALRNVKSVPLVVTAIVPFFATATIDPPSPNVMPSRSRCIPDPTLLHVVPVDDISVVPLSPTIRNLSCAKTTPSRRSGVPEATADQWRRSVDLRITPRTPATTYAPLP